MAAIAFLMVRVELTHQIHRQRGHLRSREGDERVHVRSAHDRLGDDAGVSQRLLGLGDRTTLQQVLFGVGRCQQWPECHRSSDT